MSSFKGIFNSGSKQKSDQKDSKVINESQIKEGSVLNVGSRSPSPVRGDVPLKYNISSVNNANTGSKIGVESKPSGPVDPLNYKSAW